MAHALFDNPPGATKVGSPLPEPAGAGAVFFGEGGLWAWNNTSTIAQGTSDRRPYTTGSSGTVFETDLTVVKDVRANGMVGETQTPVDAGETLDATLVVDGVATVVEINFAGGEQTKTNDADAVSILQGSAVRLRLSSSDPGGAEPPVTSVAYREELPAPATGPGEALHWTTDPVAVGATVPRFINAWGGMDSVVAEAHVSRMFMPKDGTLENMEAHSDNQPGGGNSYIYTALVDGVASVLSATISGASNTGGDTDTVAVLQAAKVTLEFDKGGGDTNTGNTRATAQYRQV